MTLEAATTVRVWVQNQGPDLSQQQAQIWKRFYQAPRTPVQSGWKVDLGLYICQQLIRDSRERWASRASQDRERPSGSRFPCSPLHPCCQFPLLLESETHANKG